ncbi:hypothetical protein [Blastococcus sp. CT_GayMR16]|uniref:hypothetical protein n=1 Tax=Blastococcus sp. CT_GayMR16 TaxID=2559607 RepID=UPI0010748D4C|nr:hypothetical protein [Blastococcus sp. CT_GayMR16]TFV91227.1 hypothetical protein E4P38_01075 [Blastococcus sp. CT_GayMR16]
MTQGPFLYDDDPAPLHTGTPRRSGRLLVMIFGATALVAVLMVVLLPLIKGSGEEQSREVVQVFLAALDQDDTETAYQLLCEDERAQVAPDEIAGRYVAAAGGGEVGAVAEAEVDGEPVRQVTVEWADGTSTGFVVVNSDGPHVCGLAD